MAEIGFETYQKILEEAIRELKRSKFQDLFQEEITQQDDFVKDCTIDTDLEILLPDSYVESIAERLSLYQRMDECESEQQLLVMQQELLDRFGPLPESVVALLDTVRCRKLAVELGFEKMSLKDGTLRCFFINRPDSPYFESNTFKRILEYLQTGTNRAKLKQTGRLFLLVVEDVAEMADLHRILKNMHLSVFKEVGS